MSDPTPPRSESGEAGISPETRRALEVHACRTDDDSIYRSLTGREPGGAPTSSAEEIAAELEEIADYAEFQDETCASLRRAAAWIRAAEKERDELRAAINTDGSLTTHEDFVCIARDGAHALDNINRIAYERDAAVSRAEKAEAALRDCRRMANLLALTLESPACASVRHNLLAFSDAFRDVVDAALAPAAGEAKEKT